uniref:Ig-like domain-containing protein n=5 Tax=Metatheria TaxID=9263 RepID=A0A4X2KEU1_VOMUR
MVCVLLPRGIWTEVLAVTLLVLNSQVAAGRHAPKHFTEQLKFECYFENGMERVRYADRHIHNCGEYARFDTDLGEYVAVTELGRPDAAYWNSRKEFLEDERAAVNTYCRHNYGVIEPFLVRRSAEYGSPGHHNLLVCSVSGFYPGDIEVRWFLNGQEETAGVVSTGLISNGDWTYQILVMLEVTPKRGDVYTCRVEHSSLQKPVVLDWKARSESARSKMLSGGGASCWGNHKRSQKGEILWGKP